MPVSPGELAVAVKDQARRLGFALVGIASPQGTEHGGFYREWLAQGFHGGMAYLARRDSVARREELKRTMESVQSVVVVAEEYCSEDAVEEEIGADRAVIARYARGGDYHDVVKGKLLDLLLWLDRTVAGGVQGRPYVDTGPILERDLAQRAGLGWFGRNTMLINPTRGSYFFIGILLVDCEITPDWPFAVDRCGSCHACLDACPTGALLGRDESGAPVIDSRRCISYLTIELRGPIPRELRPGVANRVFGCDICQEVCPWNQRFAGAAEEPAYLPREELRGPSLIDLTETALALDDAGFREHFRGSPLLRARRAGMLRNLCVALGNWGSEEAVEVLAGALHDAEPLVRGHAAWALGRIGSGAAEALLEASRETETDPWVREETSQALG